MIYATKKPPLSPCDLANIKNGYIFQDYLKLHRVRVESCNHAYKLAEKKYVKSNVGCS